MPHRLSGMRKLLAAALLLAAVSLSAAEMSYILRRGADSHVVMGNMTLDGNFDKLLSRFSGHYLWARIDGREYLIRDTAVLAEAKAAFAEAEKHQQAYHALTKKMRPLERQYDELEEKLDELTDQDELSREEEREVRRLEQQMKPLEKQVRALEEEEERLDEKQEVLEAAAERKLEQIIRRAIRSGVADRL